MRRHTILMIAWLLLSGVGCRQAGSDIRRQPIKLTGEEIVLLKKELRESDEHYDAGRKMIWMVTKEKHYHSDLDSGVRVHDTRGSIQYAAALLRMNDTASIARGVDILKTILPLQEKDTSRAFCGVWPYYPEDPLAGRKAPVDYNWADFISVSLIDIMLNAPERIDNDLKQQVREALILAAHAIMKRDVKADYTNICIMGTYVCYVVGNLYEQPDIKNYGQKKLAYFYNFTKESKGFTEYNSPTYTVVAMNELLRMKLAITNPADKKMVDELYNLCWSMIARHFHQPSGQWCGPNLRAYNDLLTPELKQLFFYASNGQVNLPGEYLHQPRVLEPHQIPPALLHYFLEPDLPRTETDTFTVGKYQVKNHATFPDGEMKAQDITGKLYMQQRYALASVNQGYLWNQCRPLIAHWGSPEHPSYLRVRFLHDQYDFAAVHIKSVQDSSTVLSVLNLAYNGGDRHPNLDRLKDTTLAAADLRLRIETGGDISASSFSLSTVNKRELQFSSGDLRMLVQVPYCNWNGEDGHWELGAAGDKKWADYVIHSGSRKVFDLRAMKEAVIGLSLSVAAGQQLPKPQDIKVIADNKYLQLSAGSLLVKALKKPDDEFRIKNDFEIYSK